MPSRPPATDRVYRTTRALCIGIVPFLLLGIYALYLRTSHTRQLWAWEIKSPMSALLLASAYAGGAYYFTRAAFARRWHHIGLGLVPVATFAALMALVTIIHWSQFLHANLTFTLWTALYFVTPFLVAAAWLSNRREDPGTPDESDVLISDRVRRICGVAGGAGLIFVLVVMLAPSLLVAAWGWPLTPLTARVIGVIFALFDVYLIGLAGDARWSASRLNIECLAVATVFIGIGIARTAQTFNWSRPLAWVFTLGTLGVLVTAVGALIVNRRRPAPG